MSSTVLLRKSQIYGRKCIIVGKSGNGKSSLGNTLLKRNAFLASICFDGVTTECQLEEDIGGITVVDTPGLFDTKETNGNAKKIALNALSILKSLDICCNPHAFLLTLNGACRLTDEELSVMDVLRITFGNEWISHGILVVTHIDNDVNDSEFMKMWKQCETLEAIVKEFEGRICRIDNKNPKDEHVSRIRDEINQVSQNGKRSFSIEYSDCRRNVLQNEEKLEDYNAMQTHNIIKEIAKDIQKETLREARRREKKKKEKEEQAELERKKKKTKTMKTTAVAITGGAGAMAGGVACALTASMVIGIGICSGGAGAILFGLGYYIWKSNN